MTVEFHYYYLLNGIFITKNIPVSHPLLPDGDCYGIAIVKTHKFGQGTSVASSRHHANMTHSILVS